MRILKKILYAVASMIWGLAYLTYRLFLIVITDGFETEEGALARWIAAIYCTMALALFIAMFLAFQM
jgi:hypothetical protein